MSHLNSKSFPMEVLKALGYGLALYFILSSPQGTRLLLKGIKKEWNQRTTRQTLRRLQAKKLIEIKNYKNGMMKAHLTKKGNEILRSFQIKEIRLSSNRDGYWRIIFFDIPESQKRARDILRAKFQEWGAYPLQRSVYISGYPCEKEIIMLEKLLHIPLGAIFVVKTRELSNETALKSHFGF